MANTTLQIRHSTVAGNTPSSLANGEIAINSRDGVLFYSTPSGVVTSFSTGPSGLDTEIQFNDGGNVGGSEKLTFNKTTGQLTVNGTVRANLFSDDGTDLYDFSNRAFTTANAAFASANNIDGVNVTQNNSIASAFIHANAVFANANSYITYNEAVSVTQNNSIAAAFASANNIDGVNVTQNNSIASAFVHANAVFANANSYITYNEAVSVTQNNSIASAFVHANSGFIHANAAFTAANNATDTYVRNHANSAFIQANASFTTANLAFTTANASYNVLMIAYETQGTGACTTFNMGFKPYTANSIFVSVDGVIQSDTTYSVDSAANTITFVEAPASYESVRIVGFKQINPYIIENNSIDFPKLQSSVSATINASFNHANSAFTAANSAASTGKAIAMSIVFGG